jgi:hypothetical protein
MAKKKQKDFFHGFDRVWFKNDTEYVIFLIWGTFVCVYLLQLI